MKATPLPGVIAAMASRDPAAVLSRIITPARAQGSVFCCVTTRATIWPLPLRGW